MNVNFPFQYDGRGRTLDPQGDYLRQLVEQVLFTSPGERVNLVYAAKVDLDAGWNEPLVPGQPADVRVKVAESAPAKSPVK